MAAAIQTTKLQNPLIIPSQLVLAGAWGSGTVTSYYMNDADGMASQINPPGPGAVEMTVVGPVNLDSVKEYLKTFALVIGGYNFYSSDASQLSNNLVLTESAFDGTTATKPLFSAQFVSSFQNNPNLLNISIPFILTNTSSLKINVLATSENPAGYTFTFKVMAAVPYGKLDEFIAGTTIAVGAGMCQCMNGL